MYDGFEFEHIGSSEWCLLHQVWFSITDYGCPICEKEINVQYCSKHDIHYTSVYKECPYCIDEKFYCTTTQ